jgi:D-galactarolactone cycloisomerase
MTIRSITTIALSLPFDIGAPKPAFAGKPREMEMLLIRVETDAGLVGWGEAFGFAVWPATRAVIKTLIAPIMVGRDEADIAGIHLELSRKLHLLGRTGPVMYAISGLDIALWDIAGKAAGKSIAELLGGRRRESIPAYASLLRYGDTEFVEINAARAVAEGYERIKLHEITVPQILRARAAIGPGIKLMVDANCPWSVEESIAMNRDLAEADLLWLEEPVWPPEDYAALARVRAAGPAAVAAGENAFGYLDFLSMFEKGAVDHAQPSVTKIGGIAEMMRIARLAKEWGVALAPHSPYVGPGLLATAQIAAALDEEVWLEHCYCTIDEHPLGDAVRVRDGRFQIPSGPGLGRDPDPALVAKYTIK